MAKQNPYAKYLNPETEEEKEKEENPYAKYVEGEMPLDEKLKIMQKQAPGMQGVGIGAIRAGLNAPRDAKDAALGAWEMIKNPVETAKGLGKVAVTAGDALISADTGREFEDRYGVAEGFNESVKEFAKDPAETIIQNPVDAAMMLTPFGKNPLQVTEKAARTAAGKIANKQYRSAAGMPKVSPDVDYRRVAERGLDDEIPVSEKGYSKLEGDFNADGVRVGGLKKRIGEDIQAMIDQTSGHVPVSQINKYLNEMTEKLRGTSGGQANIATINKIRNDLYAEFGNRNFITPQELQKFKTNIYQQVYEAKTDAARRFDISTKTKAEQGRGAKDYLEKIAPETKPLNKQWGELAQLSPWIEKRMNTISRMEPGVQRFVLKTLGNPAGRSKVAIALNRYAKGTEKWMKGLNSHEIYTVLALVGGQNEMLENMFGGN
jgi:hypothetical protein